MARLPFDPARARGGLFDNAATPNAATPHAAQSQTPAQPKPLTVAQAATLVKGTVMGLGRLRIQGEISSPGIGKHCYFQLKDEGAVLSCAMWGSTLARSEVKPTQGENVIVEGAFDVYLPNGKLSFIVDRLQHVGAGDLDARFRALTAALRDLGYFDEARKKPLPLLPRRVAIVTSLGGAALQDCFKTAKLRCPWIPLLIVGVLVQGADAAGEVASAIDTLNAQRTQLGIDVIVVTRGGGSREDLQAFNERIVADAAFRSVLPVVAAIGHECDTSVLDLVADLRASTPTQAMMAIFPEREELLAQLQSLRDRLTMHARRSMRAHRQQLQSLATRSCLRDARALLRLPRERLARDTSRLRTAIAARHQRARGELQLLAQRLHACAPRAAVTLADTRLHGLLRRLRTLTAHGMHRQRLRCQGLQARLESVAPERALARGYSITFDHNGHPIRDAASIPHNTLITTRLHHGELHSRTESPR